MNRILCTVASVLLFLVSAGGCGSGNPKTHKVTGIVTYQGKVVDGASVSFFVKGAARPSSGLTDAQGKFTLTTFAANDGALPGDNIVTVTKVESNEMKPEDMAKMMSGGATRPPVPKALLPLKYASEEGGLTAKVEPGKTNDFKFDLTD